MKKKKLIILFFLCTFITENSNTTKQPPTSRAKNMIRGVKPYRKKVLNLLYDFLRTSQFDNYANNLKQWMDNINTLEGQIDTTIERSLQGSEKINYRIKKRNLYNSRVRMNAQVLDETNQLFNTIDNITSNASQEIINYRKEKSSAHPEIKTIQNEITKHKEKIKKIEQKLTSKLAELNPKLKKYYNRMIEDTSSLFNQVKNLGQKITSKAGVHENNVLLLNKEIQTIKKQKAEYLLKNLNLAKNNRNNAFRQIDTAIETLSEAERVRWEALRDLYNRVELVEQTIMYGSTPIKQWKLPSHILRITPPQ